MVVSFQGLGCKLTHYYLNKRRRLRRIICHAWGFTSFVTAFGVWKLMDCKCFGPVVYSIDCAQHFFTATCCLFGATSCFSVSLSLLKSCNLALPFWCFCRSENSRHLLGKSVCDVHPEWLKLGAGKLVSCVLSTGCNTNREVVASGMLLKEQMPGWVLLLPPFSAKMTGMWETLSFGFLWLRFLIPFLGYFRWCGPGAWTPPIVRLTSSSNVMLLTFSLDRREERSVLKAHFEAVPKISK